MSCPCIKKQGTVAPLTLFESVTAGKKFYNVDMRCDFAGNKIAAMVENGEITQEHAISEIIRYAKRITKEGKIQETHMLAWMCMHLALGLCHKFNVKDKAIVRAIMQDILPYSRGIDMGIFVRDILALGETGQFLDANEKEMLQKAMYYFRLAANFKIDFRDQEYARSVFGYSSKLPQFFYYIDLPLGNPAYAMGTAAPSRAQPLQVAIESLKPHAVLLLLRYGATAHGEPLSYTLASLSHARTVEKKTTLRAADTPLEQMKLILDYLLRSVNHLKLKYDSQKIGDMDHDEDVYYVSENIEEFLEARFYKQPNNLKHLCRTRIRELVRDNDGLPEALHTFNVKKMITTHKRYLDLLSA